MDVGGLSVAIVGRSASAIGQGYGAEIDACGVVVRINTVLPIDPALWPDLGRRTDIVYHCRSCFEPMNAARANGVTTVQMRGKFRKRLARTVRRKGYRPYTGTVAIYQFLRWGAAEVRAYAMDLHVGVRYDGTKGGDFPAFNPATPMSKRWRHYAPHDRELLRRLLPDSRFVPDRRLRCALEVE